MSSRREYLCARGRAVRAALVVMVLTVVLAPSAAPGGQAGATSKPQPAEKAAGEPAKKAATGELTGENAVMAREVDLTPKQRKQVAQTVSQANKALAQWREANREKIQSANAALTKAREAGDRQALRQALVDAQPLFRRRRAIQQKYQKKIMDVMTAKQQVKWVGYVLWRGLTGQVQALDLTPEQSDQTRAMCDEAAKKLVALPEAEEATQADAQTAQTIQKNLVDRFVQQILTEGQRETLKQPAGGGPAGPPSGGGKAPADAPKTPDEPAQPR